MKKRMLLAVLDSILSIALAACSGNENTISETKEQTSGVHDEKINDKSDESDIEYQENFDGLGWLEYSEDVEVLDELDREGQISTSITYDMEIEFDDGRRYLTSEIQATFTGYKNG